MNILSYLTSQVVDITFTYNDPRLKTPYPFKRVRVPLSPRYHEHHQQYVVIAFLGNPAQLVTTLSSYSPL